eukprot:TRINITY_DN23789_c0_g1_i1.p1 TRINITY_DN23789_c0_g1~~TRINITY_DN23789_c0_g1_i1.p1  ORF type:complete len:573 (+),score=117.66 TRINITY_DN23789_c0_g1_i1:20-1738(+)
MKRRKMSSSSTTLVVGVEARIKWFDPRRGFGFCTCPSALASAAMGASGAATSTGSSSEHVVEARHCTLDSSASRGDGADADVDVFFGSSEAEVARSRGLSLARGERLLCDLVRRPVKPKPCLGNRGDDESSGSCRLEAAELRLPTHPGGSIIGGVTEGDALTSHTDAAVALEALATRVSQDLIPAFGSTSTFQVAASQLLEVMREAWDHHAAAGRENLEAFVQGPCFEAVQVFSRHVLFTPEAFSLGHCEDNSDGDVMLTGNSPTLPVVRWLDKLAAGPWCWSPQQRRVMKEWRTIGEQVHSGGNSGNTVHISPQIGKRACNGDGEADADPNPEENGCGASKIDAVISQRTQRFVIVLEGVRNSANQQMILRTCEAMGIQEVWHVPPPDGVKYRAPAPRSRNASRGCERFLSLRRFANAGEVSAACDAEGRELWATHCTSSALSESARPAAGEELLPSSRRAAIPLVAGVVPDCLPRLALVLGTEGEGVSSSMLDLATRWIYLPMFGFVQSLNVAVACGMLVQRLFDLCPEARGDLTNVEFNALREQALRAVPRFRGDEAVDSHSLSGDEIC